MEKTNCNIEKVCMCIPKAELHLHIEGTIEPEMTFHFAKRNNINLKYNSPEELREKYNFKDLQSFLDVYYDACSVIISELDFFELTYAYFEKVSNQGLKYVEIFFDPQTHLPRQIDFSTFMNGFNKAILKAKSDFGIEAQLIMCFQRHLTEEDALKTLELAYSFKSSILGIGLDSSEKGFPPELFKNVYAKAKEQGYRLVAHAGEEGPPKNIETSIDLLKVERIDHGITVLEDEKLMKRIGELKIPFTLCPLSNMRLQVVPDLKEYPIRKMLKYNMLVMLNSDDPSYFGGYIGDNFVKLQNALNLTLDEIITLAENSFKASFLNTERKEYYLNLIKEYVTTI